jgi:hypothetical protein
MKQTRKLDFTVDKLTNSIENILTGEIFETDVVRVGMDDLALVEAGKWQFDWARELRDHDREVYKLTTKENPSIIQGLMCLEDRRDHMFVHLIENASFNVGRGKLYAGVPGNLMAFACKIAFENGYQGYVAFDAKSRLIPHYESSLGAKRFAGIRMLFDTTAAYNLVRRYFKDFDNGGAQTTGL